MLDLLSIHVDAVIVVLGVHDEATPLPPAGRNIRPIVLVEVLSKVPRPVAHIGQVRGKGLGLVRRLPHGTRAIVVVREHVMVVDVHAREDTGTGRTAHGRCCVGVPELCAIVT